MKGVAFLLSIVICFLAGCASSLENPTIRLALTEMGNSSDSEYGAYGTRVQRVVSISGLGAEEVVGTLTTDIDKWSLREQLARYNPLRQDLPDALNPRLVSGQSFIVERSHASAGNTQQALVELAQELEQYQVLLAGSARQNLDQAIRQFGNEKQLPAEEIAGLVKSDKVPENTGGQQHQEMGGGQQGAESLRSSILHKLQHGGIMVMAWSSATRQSASAGAGSAVSTSGGSQHDVDGFLVIGNPAVTTLFIGDDVLARAVASTTSRSLFKTHRNYLTHFQLRNNQGQNKIK